MSQINVSNLTFCHEGSSDNIFEQVSFSVDTDWKLGFLGRNGKGKTTFLNLLLGRLEYTGSISASVVFDYFPYQLTPEERTQCCAEFYDRIKPGCELWRVICELEKLGLFADVLYRPFGTLSPGERTKVMLAVLFSGENDFLLIDEPTNHLDRESRESVRQYLQGKKGFILVSHDRDLLDACVDHVLVLNRCSIEVQSGNFSSWWENKRRRDQFAEAENEKHLREISSLKKASERTRSWADKNESSKIGFDPVKEHDRSIATRAYIGAKTKKMQSRVKQLEQRIGREIEEKEGLLQDIETPAELKLMPLRHHKEVLVSARDYGIAYPSGKTVSPDAASGTVSGAASVTASGAASDAVPDLGSPSGNESVLFHGLDFELRQGERVFLHGRNGCGKSSLIRAILAHSRADAPDGQALPFLESGALTTASGLVISYISQDTSFLRGTIRSFCAARGLEESLFCAILRQLDLERAQFARRIEEFSEGQKKKVLIAASLLQSAHLYIWDEPLNYVDVFSRMQIENLILKYQPTMLLVDHDVRFREKTATRVVDLQA